MAAFVRKANDLFGMVGERRFLSPVTVKGERVFIGSGRSASMSPAKHIFGGNPIWPKAL